MFSQSLCDTAHRNILFGSCPWCGHIIVDGRVLIEPLDILREVIASARPGWAITEGERTGTERDFEELEATDYLLAIIQGLGREATGALPLLRLALRDRDPEVRAAAADALARMGPCAMEAMPALLLVLDDKNERARDAAQKAIRSIEEGSEREKG